jgi:lipocalin-like protein
MAAIIGLHLGDSYRCPLSGKPDKHSEDKVHQSLVFCVVMGVLALRPEIAASQQKSFKDELIGSWTIVSNDNIGVDGEKRQIFGPNPKGLFILGADGRYALVVGTSEENKAVIAGTVASFGTWKLDEATNTLITSAEGDLFPNAEGRDQRRIIALVGDELRMVNTSPGSGGRAEIVFKRAK